MAPRFARSDFKLNIIIENFNFNFEININIKNKYGVFKLKFHDEIECIEKEKKIFIIVIKTLLKKNIYRYFIYKKFLIIDFNYNFIWIFVLLIV